MDLQQQFTEATAEARDLLTRTQAQANVEGRPMTANERSFIEAATRRATDLKNRLRQSSDARFTDQFDRVTGGQASTTHRGAGLSLGQLWVGCETNQWLAATQDTRTGTWFAPASEFPGLTLHATTLDTTSGSGGPLILPDTRPGIVQLPTRPLVVADLAMPGVTDSNVVQYMKEKTFTNAAAAVAQAGLKPESTLVFETATSAVQKIAHWIPVTEEMLEDSAQISSYIDARLRTGVLTVEDSELLNGTGIAPHLLGFAQLPGLAAGIARVAEVNADTVLSQMMAIWIATNVQPDGIVMNPAQWKTILQTKDTTGQYYGGGPFASPHAPTLWGLPVALSTAMAAGSCLVGCFKTCSQVFRRGGVRVEASNSHASFFVTNMVAIRAEERLALAVYREAAFGLCTNLN